MEHTEEGMNPHPKCISVILELTHLTRSWVSKYQVPCCPQNRQKEATPTVACGKQKVKAGSNGIRATMKEEPGSGGHGEHQLWKKGCEGRISPDPMHLSIYQAGGKPKELMDRGTEAWSDQVWAGGPLKDSPGSKGSRDEVAADDIWQCYPGPGCQELCSYSPKTNVLCFSSLRVTVMSKK